MNRAFNFSAGPAMLPLEVLQQASEEMCDWQGTGMSVMEMSHRGKEFLSIYEQTVTDLRNLMTIPENYKVLFLQGGATAQNALVPLNLLGGKTQADYVNTGAWSKKSIKEASNYCSVNVAATSESDNFTHIPNPDTWSLDPGSAYVHICANETIGGVEYHFVPDTGDVPLVADMSSNLLSRPVDVSRYGLIYGGAQKNIGPAGVTIVIVRDDLIGQAATATPTVFNYQLQADKDSMLNTPSTYGIYIAGLVFQWIKSRGGLEAMQSRNQEKAALLYNLLDTSEFFSSPVAKENRSLMNVPFTLKDSNLESKFLTGAQEKHMLQLKGHRSVGGMRASIYNAMPKEGVEALVRYMKAFEESHT
ncbi:MAG: 3-phosphoserine/phosphohydroxythreonine transaminase [Lysobacterales bacterium]